MSQVHELPSPHRAKEIDFKVLTDNWLDPSSLVTSRVRDFIKDFLFEQLRLEGEPHEIYPHAPSGEAIKRVLLGGARSVVSRVIEPRAYGDSPLEKAAEMARQGNPISAKVLLELNNEGDDPSAPIMATAHFVAALKSRAIREDMMGYYETTTISDFYSAQDHLIAGLIFVSEAVSTERKIMVQRDATLFQSIKSGSRT